MLSALTLAAAAAYIGAFVIAAIFRLSYPFPLEITESAARVQVQRILQTLPLYTQPTLRHVPLIYGPVYFYCAALLALITGPSYLALRLVSLAASLGSLALVGDTVRRETQSWSAGLLAAGLLGATYPLGQTAFDLGRVDALFLFFILASAYLAYFNSGSQSGAAASGALLGLAALTKAPIAALPVGLATLVYLLVARPRQAPGYLLGVALVLGGGLLLLRLQSGPWPTWFLWDLVRMHDLRQNLLGRFWFADLLPRFTLPLLIGPVFLLARALEGRLRPLLFWPPLWLAMIGVAWASRSNIGASSNVLLPAFATVGVAFGLAAFALTRAADAASASRHASAFRSYALGLCLVQLALLAYNPRLSVPYRSDQAADQELATRLGALPAPLFAPNLEGYVEVTGTEQPYFIAVGDLDATYGGTPTREGLAWWSDLKLALQQRQFASVVLRDEDCCAVRSVVLDAGYADDGPLFAADDQFWLLKTSHTPEVHLFSPPPA